MSGAGADIARRLRAHAEQVGGAGFAVEGLLQRVVGLTLEASGCRMQIGGRCRIHHNGDPGMEAEVVGFAGDRTYLMPTGEMRGLVPNARVLPLPHAADAAVGEALLGRVLDGEGRPLDGRAPPRVDHRTSLMGEPINPLSRVPIDQPLDVGVRAINGLLTLGRGQRIGLFAGSGVGKSTLLSMMTRFTEADVIVVGLIGERGREVRDFVAGVLGERDMQRAVVIATPADRPPLMRLRGAWLATAVAEYFRDRGRKVLLLMDSLTRFAQAQREVGLAVGEPPTTRGYPPSVFARLPQLVERAGTVASGGSITGIYTVLTEGDDPNDPVADSARAILDGHIVLSRQIAEAGRYPAIDIEASISRLAGEITSSEQQDAAARFRRLYACYQNNRELIQLGAYRRGTDPETDRAIELWPAMEAYLSQRRQQASDMAASATDLAALFAADAEADGDNENEGVQQ